MQQFRSRFSGLRRRDRPSSFFLTLGSVDAVIGGVSSHGSLLFIGLAVMGIGAALRLQKPVPQPQAASHLHRLPSRHEPSES